LIGKNFWYTSNKYLAKIGTLHTIKVTFSSGTLKDLLHIAQLSCCNWDIIYNTSDFLFWDLLTVIFHLLRDIFEWIYTIMIWNIEEISYCTSLQHRKESVRTCRVTLISSLVSNIQKNRSKILFFLFLENINTIAKESRATFGKVFRWSRENHNRVSVPGTRSDCQTIETSFKICCTSLQCRF
jgi:hypothetical protein